MDIYTEDRQTADRERLASVGRAVAIADSKSVQIQNKILFLTEALECCCYYLVVLSRNADIISRSALIISTAAPYKPAKTEPESA